ncbi:MAG: PEP-CTERM sorting domain-containing protein [Phycisphaeraceae bacterium]|nr:PEP-CTERM sorting domain-containing protein [Phycisphaeraceae bacterium]
MLKIAAFGLLCGCLPLSALGAWGLKFEVWNGAAWMSIVSAAPGDVVKFRFGAYFDPDAPPLITTADGSGTAMALTRFTGSNQATGFAIGDGFQNVVRTITGGSEAIVTINGSVIGTTAVTSFGSQLFPGDVPFEPYKEIYVGEVKIGASTAPRVIALKNKTFGSGNTPGLTFYNSASPVNKQAGAPQAGGPGREDMTAQIWLIPAPGSLALLGLGGLVASRRRRAEVIRKS